MLNKGLFPWITDGEVSLLNKEEQGKGENFPKSEDTQIGQMGPNERNGQHRMRLEKEIQQSLLHQDYLDQD